MIAIAFRFFLLSTELPSVPPSPHLHRKPENTWNEKTWPAINNKIRKDQARRPCHRENTIGQTRNVSLPLKCRLDLDPRLGEKIVSGQNFRAENVRRFRSSLRVYA
jgi:hypothetical protein